MKKYILIMLLVCQTTCAINPWQWIATLIIPISAPWVVPDEYPKFRAYIGGCATVGFFWCFANWYFDSYSNQANEAIENFHNITISQLHELIKQYNGN